MDRTTFALDDDDLHEPVSHFFALDDDDVEDPTAARVARRYRRANGRLQRDANSVQIELRRAGLM